MLASKPVLVECFSVVAGVNEYGPVIKAEFLDFFDKLPYFFIHTGNARKIRRDAVLRVLALERIVAAVHKKWEPARMA